jgi:hypothetical protein
VVRSGVVAIAIAGCTFKPAPAGQIDSGGGAAPGDAARDGTGVATHLDAGKLDASGTTGHLSVTAMALPPGDIALSGSGIRDWTHWGYQGATSFDHEAGPNLLSDCTITGGTQLSITQVAVSASWTNGTPDATASQTATGTGMSSPAALTFTAPAGTTASVLSVYVGGHGAQGKLDVSLSDSSATPYSDDQFSGAQAWHSVYTITYNAASAGQTLSVKWTDEQDVVTGGFAMLLSATLQ